MMRLTFIILFVLQILTVQATEIRVLIVPTYEVFEANSNIDALVETVEAFQNRIFESSGVDATVDLIVSWDFPDEADFIPDALTGCTGHQQICIANYLTVNPDVIALPDLRADEKADLVSVWIQREGWYTRNGSSATTLYAPPIEQWLQTGVVPMEAAAETYLSVIVHEKAWIWWHFAHELGHNLGLGHHPPFGGGNDGYYSADSFGYVDARYPFRTIMASNGPCRNEGFVNCPRIPIYSTTDGQALFFGHAVGDQSANAAATLRVTAPMVAAYSQLLYGE